MYCLVLHSRTCLLVGLIEGWMPLPAQGDMFQSITGSHAASMWQAHWLPVCSLAYVTVAQGVYTMVCLVSMLLPCGRHTSCVVNNVAQAYKVGEAMIWKVGLCSYVKAQGVWRQGVIDSGSVSLLGKGLNSMLGLKCACSIHMYMASST